MIKFEFENYWKTEYKDYHLIEIIPFCNYYGTTQITLLNFVFRINWGVTWCTKCHKKEKSPRSCDCDITEDTDILISKDEITKKIIEELNSMKLKDKRFINNVLYNDTITECQERIKKM